MPPSNPLTMKSPPPPSSSSKIKTLFHTFIFSQLHRGARAIKSLLLEHVQFLHFAELMKKSKKKQLHFTSFRLHYNWCASHDHVTFPNSHVYYDASWNAVVVPASKTTPFCEPDNDHGLSKYLEWLEEKGSNSIIQESSSNNEIEIDEMADLFIAKISGDDG